MFVVVATATPEEKMRNALFGVFAAGGEAVDKLALVGWGEEKRLSRALSEEGPEYAATTTVQIWQGFV